MTQPTDIRREPVRDHMVTGYRTEPRPDGSTVLVLLAVADQPYTLTQHRFALDKHLSHFLLATLTRDLDGIPDPGPRPEVAALLAALDSDNPTAFTTALDAYTGRLLNLWTNGGGAA
ncbi:hypothetical protein [Streptomyces sp. NPDC020489]|uniref:hypothetical protein n=1 Tax=Streptomyces sp. NPDC020489 TaxID=3365077 RepID=UPI0037ACFE96